MRFPEHGELRRAARSHSVSSEIASREWSHDPGGCGGPRTRVAEVVWKTTMTWIDDIPHAVSRRAGAVRRPAPTDARHAGIPCDRLWCGEAGGEQHRILET